MVKMDDPVYVSKNFQFGLSNYSRRPSISIVLDGFDWWLSTFTRLDIYSIQYTFTPKRPSTFVHDRLL